MLGLTTRQMNRSLRYHGQTVDQIAMLDDLGAFTQEVAVRGDQLEQFPDWGFGNFDRSGDREHHGGTLKMPAGDATQLARAWLEVNCAMCHRPDGIAAHQRDMRYHVALEDMKLLDEPPKQGQLSLPSGRLIAPGRPESSELLLRIGHRGPRQMPPLATYFVDPRGLEVVRRWIERLDEGE